eukprot:6193331-Pleurochrysis_carterae.AAC.3
MSRFRHSCYGGRRTAEVAEAAQDEAAAMRRPAHLRVKTRARDFGHRACEMQSPQGVVAC